MTYSQSDLSLSVEFLEEIAAQGFYALPELIRTKMNEAMRIERQRYLGVVPYLRSSKRQGCANGYKPHTAHTRVGEITLTVPQTGHHHFRRWFSKTNGVVL